LNNEPKTENITENINLINSLEIGVKENPDAKEIEQIFKKVNYPCVVKLVV